MEGVGQGKRWATALAVAQCAAENPGCRIAVIGRSYTRWRDEEAPLIERAAQEIDGSKLRWRPGHRSLEWPNSSRVSWHNGHDKYDQMGQLFDMVWINNVSRFTHGHREALRTTRHNLSRRRNQELGVIIETGDLMAERYPQLRDCEAWLLRTANSFLELNGGWGTLWQVRDSHAEAMSLTLRWGEGDAECRALIAQLSGAPDPMFCLQWPGPEARRSSTWVGDPQRHEEFARAIERYRLDRITWNELEVHTIAEKSMSECVLIAEQIGGRK